MTSDSPSLDLSMLQAIELFRSKPPTQWTKDELAAFRARLQQSPTLAAALGGQGDVDRRLAAVETALATAPFRPTLPVASDKALQTVAPPAPSKVIRRSIEAAVFLALFVGAGVWLYSLLPKSDPGTAAATSSDPKPVEESTTNSPPVPAPEPADDAVAEEDTATEKEKVDDHAWKGWTIAAEQGMPWTLSDDWDLSDPANPQPAKLLTIVGGPVILTQTLTIAPQSPLLELNIRPLHAVSRAGHIVVRVDNVTVADAPIGSGESKWPIYVPMDTWKGKEIALQVVFTPGEPAQKVACWSMDLAETRRHEPRAESALAEGLASKDPKTRLLVLRRAGVGEDLAALPALVEALQDSDARIRQGAVAALMRFKDPRARAALRATLEGNGDIALRTMIAVSFANKPQPEDVTALVKSLQDPNARLRQAVVRSLGGINNESVTVLLISTLSDSDPTVREAVAAALTRRKGKEVQPTMLQLLSGNADVAVKMHAVNFFQANPTKQAIAPLAALLTSDNENLRRQAVRAIGRLPDEAAIDALGVALGDSNPSVRKVATMMLKQSRHPKAAALLKEKQKPEAKK